MGEREGSPGKEHCWWRRTKEDRKSEAGQACDLRHCDDQDDHKFTVLISYYSARQHLLYTGRCEVSSPECRPAPRRPP